MDDMFYSTANIRGEFTFLIVLQLRGVGGTTTYTVHVVAPEYS